MIKSTNLKFSLKSKSFGFVASTIVLVLMVVATGLLYYSKIEKANLLKEETNQVLEKVTDTRAIEKAYLQFYTAELKKRFDQMAQNVGSDLKNLQANSAEATWKEQFVLMEGKVAQYRKLFGDLVKIHEQREVLKQETIKPLVTSEQLLIGMDKEIQKKQAMLQMEGEKLGSDELGLMNVLRDCRLAALKLQAAQQQYLITGKDEFVKEFKELASGELPIYLLALQQFSVALKNDQFEKAANTVKESTEQFLEYTKESQQLFGKERDGAKLLDKAGSQIMSLTKSFMDQVGAFIAEKKNRPSSPLPSSWGLACRCSSSSRSSLSVLLRNRSIS